jgi:Fur family zinc uptake transcriptional regulator
VLKLLQQHPDGVKAYQLLAMLRHYQQNDTPPTVYRALDFLITQRLEA